MKVNLNPRLHSYDSLIRVRKLRRDIVLMDV